MIFRHLLATSLLATAGISATSLYGQSFEIPSTALIRPLGAIDPAPCSAKLSQVLIPVMWALDSSDVGRASERSDAGWFL